MKNEELNIKMDLNYLENLETKLNESDISQSSRFGYWNHIGNEYSIKLTIEEVKQVLNKRLNKLK